MANPHKSFSALNAKRARAEAALLQKARLYYVRADRLEKQGKPLQARAEAAKGKKLVQRAHKGGQYTDGPVGRLPNPKRKSADQLLAMQLTAQRTQGAAEAAKQKYGYGSAKHLAAEMAYKTASQRYQRAKTKANLKQNPTKAGLQAELSQVDRDIAELETDPFYRETTGRRAFARKWLAHHRRQRREIERLLRRRTNGVVEAAAGLQALEYLGGKVKGKRNPEMFVVRWWPDGKQFLEHWFRSRASADTFADKKDAHAPFVAIYSVIKGYFTKVDGREPRTSNPSVTALSKTFQGGADGAIDELWFADTAPKNTARAGKLVFLKVAGRSLKIPGAMVAIAPNGKLWIGGDHAPLFNTKAKPGEGLDFGEVSHICYKTAKSHIENGETCEYVHEFGEEGGARPRLIIDHEGMPILRGGDYKIQVEGIVN